MADLALVTLDTGHNGPVTTKAMLERKGHTVTLYAQASVTASNLAGHDGILALRVEAGQTALAGFLADYMAVDGIPVLIGFPRLPAAGDTTTDLASLLGIIGGATVALNQGVADAVPDAAIADHQVTSGLDPALPIALRADPHTGSYVTAGKPTAGRDLVYDQAGHVLMTLCDADGEYGRRLDTLAFFGARSGFIGWLYGGGFAEDYGKEGAALIDAAIGWATGASGFGYPTGRTAVAVTRAIDLTPLGGDSGSAVSWSAVVPGAGGSVALYASLDDGLSWDPIASSGDPVPGLTASTPTAGLAVRLKAELATSTTADTPALSDLRLIADGAGPALRKLPASAADAAPDGWLDGGLLTWRTGANAGLSMEVGHWNASTRALSLFLPMPFQIAVGDVFSVYPGCDKTLATCRDKFANVANFRGEPYVPGNDKIIRGPND